MELDNDNFGILGSKGTSLRTMLDLTLGVPKLTPFPIELFDELKSIKDINYYYPSRGSLSLRKSIIDQFYRGHSLDHISITHGAIGALDTILRANREDQAEILLPDPGFTSYSKLANFSGFTPKYYHVHLSDHPLECIDWDDLKTKITPKTKLILLNSPSNPTGKILYPKDVQELVKLMDQFPNLKFIMDEAYREFIYGQEAHLDLSSYIERGYIVGTFSKMFPLSGARVGWVLTSENLMKELTPFFNHAYGAVSSFGQEMANLLLNSKKLNLRPYADAKNLSTQILDQYQIKHLNSRAGLFHFINVKSCDIQFTEKLEKSGVLVVPGSKFGLQGRNYIRACFAVPDEILKRSYHLIAEKILEEGLK
ncbi:MAG: pyridoxal phosphate-dependent aminotransferase [Bacteriovoracaceae bacterium]